MASQNSNMAFQNFNMAFQNSEHGVSKLRTWCFTRCRARTSNDAVEGKGPLFFDSKKITPRPPPSPSLRSVSFTTNVLGEPCVAAHTRQRQAVSALRGNVYREAMSSNTMRFTRASCQAAFDTSNTTLSLLGLERQLPRCAFCSLASMEAALHNSMAFLHLANPRTLCLVLHRHGPFGQLAQLGAIVHEGVRDVAAAGRAPADGVMIILLLFLQKQNFK